MKFPSLTLQNAAATVAIITAVVAFTAWIHGKLEIQQTSKGLERIVSLSARDGDGLLLAKTSISPATLGDAVFLVDSSGAELHAEMGVSPLGVGSIERFTSRPVPVVIPDKISISVGQCYIVICNDRAHYGIVEIEEIDLANKQVVFFLWFNPQKSR